MPTVRFHQDVGFHWITGILLLNGLWNPERVFECILRERPRGFRIRFSRSAFRLGFSRGF